MPLPLKERHLCIKYASRKIIISQWRRKSNLNKTLFEGIRIKADWRKKGIALFRGVSLKMIA